MKTKKRVLYEGYRKGLENAQRLINEMLNVNDGDGIDYHYVVDCVVDYLNENHSAATKGEWLNEVRSTFVDALVSDYDMEEAVAREKWKTVKGYASRL